MIFFPFIYFLIILIIFSKKYGFSNIGVFIIGIYLVSSLFSIFAYKSEILDFNNVKIGLIPTLTYCGLITFIIYPFLKVNNQKIRSITKPSIQFFNLLSWMLIINFILTIILNISELSITINSNLAELREDINLGNNNYSSNSNILTEIIRSYISFFSEFSAISLFLYFYSVLFLKKSKFFNLLLFISSLNSVLLGFLIAGRTQVVYWLLSFIFIFLFFYSLMSKKDKYKILLPFLYIAPFLIGYFVIVTVLRFDNQGKNIDSISSIVSYTGQSFINFCRFYDEYKFSMISLERIFPFSNKYFFGNTFNLDDYRFKIFSSNGLDIGVFYTFLGDLLVDLGKFGLYFYIFIFHVITRKIAKRKEIYIYNFNHFFILIILALIPIQGVFYYSYWKVTTSYMIIGCIILYFLFNNKTSEKQLYYKANG